MIRQPTIPGWAERCGECEATGYAATPTLELLGGPDAVPCPACHGYGYTLAGTPLPNVTPEVPHRRGLTLAAVVVDLAATGLAEPGQPLSAFTDAEVAAA